MLRLSWVLVLILSGAQVGLAGQQPKEPVAQALPRGAVTVFHSVDMVKLAQRLKPEQISIGIMMPAGRNPIIITTGLVLDQAGHIVTRLVNLDPEDMDQDLAVRTSDGLQFKAKLVGVDCPTGFAVIEVAPGSGLAPAATVDGTVNEGIQVRLFTSDLGHKAEISDGRIKFSTEVTSLDGKIVPGTLFSRARGALTLESTGLGPKNDSGIVETLDNKVVGMAQWAGLSSDMAYVFPYEFLRAQVLARVLDRNGTVPAGWLGVVPDTPAAGLPPPRGVIVKEIQPKSTAEVCGLQARDIIVGLDEYEITGQAEMAAVLSALPAGRKIRLRALRDQKSMELEGVLGAQQIKPILPWVPAPRFDAPPTIEERLQVGFVARDLTPQLADYFGVKGGMLVTEVAKGSPADKAGLAAGDVVVGADGKELQSIIELRTLISAKSGSVMLLVYHNKSTVSVYIPNSSASPLK